MNEQCAAIIGMGFIGAAHLEALRRLGVTVRIVGSSPASSAALAAHHGVQSLPDWQAAIADPEVTVIHNCSPNDLHSQINLAALRRGQHVFSEKPLGCTAEDTALQLEVARASGLRHGVHFTYRGYPMVRELRERVERGDIGELRFIRGRYFQDWLLKPDAYNWRLEARASQTRVVSDIGSHLLDLTRYVT